MIVNIIHYNKYFTFGGVNIYKNLKIALILAILFFISVGSISASELTNDVVVSDVNNDIIDINENSFDNLTNSSITVHLLQKKHKQYNHL